MPYRIEEFEHRPHIIPDATSSSDGVMTKAQAAALANLSIPSYTYAQRDALTPTDGMMIRNSDERDAIQVYDSAQTRWLMADGLRSLRDELLADGPLLLWLLNETSGLVVVDSSGNGRNGTITPTSQQYAQPSPTRRTFRGALKGACLVTSDAALPWTDASPGSNWTVEFDVEPSVLIGNGGAPIFVASGDFGTLWGLGLAAGYILDAVGNSLGGTGTLIAGQGAHFATTFEVLGDFSTHMRVYVDGVLLVEQVNGVFGATSTLLASLSVNGTLANVVYYSSKLSDAQLLAHYVAAGRRDRRWFQSSFDFDLAANTGVIYTSLHDVTEGTIDQSDLSGGLFQAILPTAVGRPSGRMVVVTATGGNVNTLTVISYSAFYGGPVETIIGPSTITTAYGSLIYKSLNDGSQLGWICVGKV